MDCELCGRSDARAVALIEGAKVRVCDKCAEYGKVLYKEAVVPEKKEQKNLQSKPEIEVDIVENCGEVIKAARERVGLSRHELAAKVDEKESFLRRIEEGVAVPDEKLAKKLEHAIKIRLFEEVTLPTEKKGKEKKETTLGDLVEIKKK